MILEQILRRIDHFKYFRSIVEPIMLSKKIITQKNYEMTYDVESLQPLIKFPTTSILQEYFIPVDLINEFLKAFQQIIAYYKPNLLNISLRFVTKTNLPILNYAINDRISIVLYINIGKTQYCINYAKVWTQLIIQKAIDLGGSYYLPYMPFATKLQFQLAYPNYFIYLETKKKYDPKNRFSNLFLNEYLN